jgi:hypothetical protein
MNTPEIDRAFDNHAASIQAGLQSMSPAPRRPFSGQPHTIDDPTCDPAPELVAPPVESTAAQVLREAGIVGKINLLGMGLADVENLTTGVLTKKEQAKLTELQAACDRLAGEIEAAGKLPTNPAKMALDTPVGELPPEADIAAAVGGDDARAFRKKLAKAAATRFFDTECHPVLVGIFEKIADHLATVITERHKAEQAAFEKFVEVYGDEDGEAYRPSPGLLRLCSRRRQLLDLEIPIYSPPSMRSALAGIVAF